MKRKYLTMTLSLLVSLLLTICASAAGPAAYVTDDAGILTVEERNALEQMAKKTSEAYDFGVYIMTVENFRQFTLSDDVFDGAVALYQKHDLGMGDEDKGVLLLLSMAERDFSLITYSSYGEFLFDESTREDMTTVFLDDFGQNDWYTGFADYVDACDVILLEGPETVQTTIYGYIGFILLFPAIIAFIVIRILGAKMKSVAFATQAAAYAGDGLILTDSHDLFTHSTESRRKRQSESSGSSGTRSKSSGGFSGTSGKF